ncbi:multiple sugar transport system permease protein [Agromyces sp. PvR057]
MTATVDAPRGATPPAPRHPPAGRSPKRRVKGALTPWLMLTPGILLFAVFMAAPIFYTLLLSFQKEQVKGLGLGGDSRTREFAGLENYVATFSDPEFLASVARVLLYGLILVPTMLGLALLFALLLDARRTGAKGFSRVSIFLPYAVPAVISSLLWGFLYLPAVSPFYWIFEQLGWDDVPSLLSPGLVVFAIANIGLWGGVGFNMIVMYTSLKAVPSDIYEAARIDGASEVQIAWRIKVPIIMPALIMTALFSMIATLQVFAEPTTLRPLTNSLSTSWSPLMFVYRDAFTRDDIYSAAATSIIIALATFAISFLFLRVVQRRAFGQED